MWRAGGDEALERAAWRELVAACGAGRAGWIVRTLVPKNPGDKPQPADADARPDRRGDRTRSPPRPAAYWEAVWSARATRTAAQQAHDDLEGALGTAEADARSPRPARQLRRPAARRATTRPDHAAGAPCCSSPDAAELGAAHDLVVERAAGRRSCPTGSCCSATTAPARRPTVVEVGSPIPACSRSAPTPTPRPPTSSSRSATTPSTPTRCRSPTTCAWMFDFERALDVGMAFRFDLTPAQAAGGFGRLLVLGVRLTDTRRRRCRSA